MSRRELKVTDKRMFTADGELREEYRFLEEEAATPAPPEPDPGAEDALAAAEPPPGPDIGRSPPLEIPGTGPELGAPTFLDLLGFLAEPIPIYLGDAALPTGETNEDLEMARLHIDLLDLLRQKTAGNLTAQEATVLENLLYQFRMRFVQKRG